MCQLIYSLLSDVGIIIHILMMRKLRLRVEWCAWSHRVILHRGLMNQVHCPGWLNSRLNLERNSPVFVFYISLLTLFSLIMTLWTHFRTAFNITGPIPLDNRENRFSPSHHQTTVDRSKLNYLTLKHQ